jgi:hypothetical protein
MKPAMSDIEISFLKKYLNNSKNYFEFGSGGSTYLASLIQNIEKITSIESDKDFSKRVMSCCNNEKVNIIHANIGDVIEWGVPKNSSKPEDIWENYSNQDVKGYDTILIDGRFRVACCLQVCLQNKDCVILIHDFTDRPEYHILLKFISIIESCETLVSAKVKDDVDITEIKKLYDEYKFVWA